MSCAIGWRAEGESSGKRSGNPLREPAAHLCPALALVTQGGWGPWDAGVGVGRGCWMVQHSTPGTHRPCWWPPAASHPRAKGEPQPANTDPQKLNAHISSQLYIQGCPIGSLKLATVGVFTPRKLVNTTNQDIFPPESRFPSTPLDYNKPL